MKTHHQGQGEKKKRTLRPIRSNLRQQKATKSKVKLNGGSFKVSCLQMLTSPGEDVHVRAYTNTYLPVENDAPDEPKNQFVIPIDDVRCPNIH